MTSHADTKIDCSKVYVKKSTFSNENTGDFDGAFAAVAIKEGESSIVAQAAGSTSVRSTNGTARIYVGFRSLLPLPHWCWELFLAYLPFLTPC